MSADLVGPCIEWTGYCNPGGYGMKMTNYRPVGVHRLAWIEKHGPIPEGMYVMHLCDNPPCYNIDHLKLGTPAENTADMIAKGRARHGILPGMNHPMHKLTEDEVIEIRQSNECLRVLAERYGVRIATVHAAKTGKTWKHVGVGEPYVFTKLTEDKVRAIRQDQRPQHVIAAEYGVAINTIWSVKTGRTWKRVA